MREHSRLVSLLFAVVLLGAMGCSSTDGSGDVGSFTEDAAQDLSSLDTSEDSGVDADNLEDALVIPPTILSCPTPGPLPFETVSDSFENPETQALIDANPFVLGMNRDFLGWADQEQVIEGTFARGEYGMTVSAPVAGEWVSLWRQMEDGAWKQVGRVQSDADGGYLVTLGVEDRFGVGAHRLYAVLEGNGSCAVHTVAVWPSSSEVVVSDIDGTLTLSDEEFVQENIQADYDQKEAPGASQLMNAWAEKGYFPVYLTARPKFYGQMTRFWLERHGFPLGPLVTAEERVSGDDTVAYKAGALTHQTDDLQWQIMAAYGNATTDIGAYEEAGVNKDVTFVFGKYGGTEGTVAIPEEGYGEHIETFVNNLPEAVQPF